MCRREIGFNQAAESRWGGEIIELLFPCHETIRFGNFSLIDRAISALSYAWLDEFGCQTTVCCL
jgi:hypothetical protein